jgi:L-histidine N-alpha-methyltransferase
MLQRLHDRAVLEVHRRPQEAPEEDLRELREALSESPRRIPSKHFYDRRGSQLFEAITRLPEYYLTDAERELLETVAGEIVDELVELGAGSARKTRILLDAMAGAGCLALYVPFDVSESEVRRVALELVEEYPRLEVHGIVADFTRGLHVIPPGERRLVILLGSTIGNFRSGPARALLCGIAAPMAPGDWFLLGVDLIKDGATLEAAYDDDGGVTAAFNRNILANVNRLADADFDLDAFEHKAVYRPESHWVEMRLVARRPQTVTLGALGQTLEIGAGEEIWTEISTKYDRPTVRAMLEESGFGLVRWFENAGTFALALARRRD